MHDETPPAARPPQRTTEDEPGGDAVARRLRGLETAGAVLAAAILVAAGAIVWAAGRESGDGWLGSPPIDSFLIAFGALLLVLLSSAAHGRILRRGADEVEADEDSAVMAAAGSLDMADGGAAVMAADRSGGASRGSGETAATARPPGEAKRLHAYTWATGVSFGALAVAAALGTVVALAGRAPFYGLVICLASLLAMVARWPRRGSFEHIAEAAEVQQRGE